MNKFGKVEILQFIWIFLFWKHLLGIQDLAELLNLWLQNVLFVEHKL